MNERKDLHSQIQLLERDIQHNRGQIKELNTDWGKLIQKHRKFVDDSESKYDVLVKYCRKLETEGKKIPKEQAELQKNLDENKKIKGQLEGQQKAIKMSIKESKEGLMKMERDLAKKLRSSQFTTMDNLKAAMLSEDDLTGIDEGIKAFDKRKSENAGSIATTKKDLEEKTLPDLVKLEFNEAEKKQAMDGALQLLTRKRESEKGYASTITAIEEIERETKAIEEELTLLGLLADQVAGKIPPKVSLERFFLAQRLEEVLIAASQRMKVLSNNRFILRREELGKTDAAKAGLDLKVFDSHTGQERPVVSLSGGQMFLASLSMALGLAEVVQQRSGGVNLEALFIDEGFGSLDEETMQLALKVINELRADRMVGIISHVGELKDQIKERIEVTATDKGSHVNLVVER